MTAQPKLSAALVKAQGELHAPTKNREVTVRSDKGSYRFQYATLDEIVERVLRPVLPKHGLWFTQFVAEGQMVTRIMHESGEYLDAGVPMPTLPNKAQEAGSLLSYFKRYSLCAAFALVAEEDDDANVAAGNSYSASDRAPKNGHANGASKPITDTQRDLIQTLAPQAGKSLQEICGAYRIGSLKDLTEAQAAKLIERLREQSREPA